MNPNLNKLLTNSKQIQSFQSFRDHTEAINQFSLESSSKSIIATASFDHNIKLYDLNQLKLLQTLKGHEKGVWTCSFKPNDPNTLASGSNDTHVYLWDIKSKQIRNKLASHNQAIYDVKFSSNGNMMAVCSKGMISVWDVKNLSKPFLIIKDENKDYIYCIDFLCNDSYLISGFSDGYLLIYDIKDPKKNYKINISQNITRRESNLDVGNSIYSISRFKNTKDDNSFLTSLSDGSVRLWTFQNDEITQNKIYQFYMDPATCVNCDDENKRAISGSKDHSGSVWNLDRDDFVDYSLIGHSDYISSCAFLNSDVAVTSSWDCSLRLWKLSQESKKSQNL